MHNPYMLHINLQSVARCTAVIMYCKSPDKAVLELSLILCLQITQPMSNMFLFYVFNVFY